MDGPFTPLRLEPSLRWQRGGVERALVRAWSGSELVLEEDGTHFVYAASGASSLSTPNGAFPLEEGMYAAVVAGRVGGQGAGLAITHFGARGPFQLGGPIEERGRLRYIDGCSDSLLISPPLRGDPCLNHLHIPAGTRQSRHTHPSLRIGVIARGRGRCVTPEREYPLAPRLAFVIAPDAPHSFFTDDEALDVVVYHPDSDTGPTHEDHPMINRTIL